MTSTIPANPLRGYLDRNNLTLAEFGQRIGKYPSEVRRYALPIDHPEFYMPRPDTMRKIVDATGGEVQPNEFYGVPAALEPGMGATEV